MCGRFTLFDYKALYKQFSVENTHGLDLAPRYNIAPSQQVPVIRERDLKREIILADWGLRPTWDKKGTLKPINAKVETAAEKPFFRHAWKSSRVIVPANGYYEWKKVEGGKQPYYVYPADGGLFGFAGLLEWYEDQPNFTIMTTAANPLTKAVHDRMPIILKPDDYDDWLDSDMKDPELLRHIAGQFDGEQMRMHPVRREVGNVRNQGEALIWSMDQK